MDLEKISELGSFHNLEFGLLTAYTNEEDDIVARLVTFDRNLMIYSFRNLTLEDFEDEDKRMEGSKLEYFPHMSTQVTKASKIYLGSGWTP